MNSAEQIVPIESLFFSDAGPHLVTAPRASGARGAAARGSDLHSLLASGIAGLTQLSSEPFSAPAEIDDTLPIGDLLYRGRGALLRAMEVRDEIRRRKGAPTNEELDELFALLDLAASE